MLKERDRLIQMQVMVVDSLIIVCAFVASYYLRIWMPHLFPGVRWRHIFPLRHYLWIPIFAVPLWLLSFTYFGGLRWVGARRERGVLPSVLKPLLFCALAIALVNLIFKPFTVSRVMMGTFFFLCLVSLYGARRLVLHLATRRGGAVRHLLLAGGSEKVEDLAARLSAHTPGTFHLVGIATRTKLANDELGGIRVLGTIAQLQQIVDKSVIDDVIFADPLSDLAETEEAIRICEEVGVDAHLQADFFNVMMSRTYVEQVDGLPFLTYSSTPRFAGALLIKRIMDVVISLGLLIVLSPFSAVIAFLIKATSRGKVIFRQRRAGLRGREFTLYKFRSMVAGAEEEIERMADFKTTDGPSFKAKDDPRITKVGRLLRRLSLDELPQMWNVLKGDMSIVGPRPVPMHEVEEYERWQRRRLSMKPGITCLWQVSGRSDLAFSQWMKLDLRYIDQWSLWLDIKILLLTIPAVIRGKGSY